jgi:hypothetical protein
VKTQQAQKDGGNGGPGDGTRAVVSTSGVGYEISTQCVSGATRPLR